MTMARNMLQFRLIIMGVDCIYTKRMGSNRIPLRVSTAIGIIIVLADVLSIITGMAVKRLMKCPVAMLVVLTEVHPATVMEAYLVDTVIAD